VILTTPWTLLGLAALPVLVAVYWLRSRSRRTVVSSLAFWVDQRSPRRGGRILHRMQTPLCFFLEFLAIVLLVAAAAGPVLLKRDIVRPLVVVLDDSYSLLARGAAGRQASSRRLAQAALADELQRNHYMTRFILAGAQARLVGDSAREPTRVDDLWAQWTCQNPAADLSAAMALAAEVGGRSARILVLSDHPPATALEGGQTQWWAFGRRRPNVAFTAATRTRSGENQRVLLEVTNLSDSPIASTMTLEGGGLAAPRQSDVQLAPGAARQFFLSLPARSPALRARLDDDSLAIDNQVLLLPESAKPLRVLVSVAERGLRRAVIRALEATAQTVEVSDRPELVIRDTAADVEGEVWQLEILGGKQAVAYAGPFVIDHSHRLTQGLSLEQAIWSAPSEARPSGVPIITAGNVSLLTEREDIAGRRRLQMPLVADQSNIQDMPDWPILFANLVGWRRAGLPGVPTPNVRLGQMVDVVLAGQPKRVEVVSPSGTRRQLTVRGRRVAVPADQVGLYAIKTPAAEHQFSCNAVSRDESDLAECQSGRWGSWNDSRTYQDRRISLSWVLLVVAMAAMAAHMAVVARDSGRSGA
jgi:hypothetical protein